MTEGHDLRTTRMSGNGDNEHREMRKPDTFNYLQISPTSTRIRPPIMVLSGESEETRVPLKDGGVKRRESKGGLRGIFTRNKADKNIASPMVGLPSHAAFTEAPEAAEGTAFPRSDFLKTVKTVPATAPALPTTPKATSRTSRMNLKSKSVKHTMPPPKTSSNSSTKSYPKTPQRTSAAWDPPPLFQAYPQAIKHATLSASTLSADSIIRTSAHRRLNSMHDEPTHDPNTVGPEQNSTAMKAEKAKSKHRRQVSGSISKADWTQKIFVLVTSGYLLQYSGEGSFDRLPEKMMQLGKDSVAFASDVIPGKHWVLQISQSMNTDGTPIADSRSLLSRLAFRGADYRRTATSLLLVLDNAEDMDSWIAVVRREIEALGGKQNVSETGKPKPDEKIVQLRAKPSHRYLIQKNPTSPVSPSFARPWTQDGNQAANPASSTSPPVPRPRTEDGKTREVDDFTASLDRRMSTIRPSTGHQSITNSIMSHDGRQLDNLRDSANRLSFMSSGQRTLITSQSSSPMTSPIRDSYPPFDEHPQKVSDEAARPRPNAAAVNDRRRSMQTMQIPDLEAAPQSKNYRHSTIVMPTRPTSSHSVTPNFSTPKRLSRVLIPETSSNPTIVTTSTNASNLRDPNPKGTKKGPPVALNIRPLSPAQDSPMTSRQAPHIFTPKDSAFTMIQQVKASVISIPPRSPPTSGPISPIDLPRRMSSLMPLSSSETAHLDFQFPKQYSSMQSLRDTAHSAQPPPLRAAPLPPAVPTSPLPIAEFVPGQEISTPLPRTDETKTEKTSISALPLADTKQKLRGPTSIQIRPPPGTPFLPIRSSRTPLTTPHQRLPSLASSTGSSSFGASSPASISVISPSFHRLKVQAHPKAVGNRKSMSGLVNGPPPAPPPDYALPPLPPSSVGSRSVVGIRKPVRV